MPTELARRAEFHNGDRMSLQEFFSVWEQIPNLKRAELIDGVVHLPSPVSYPHAAYQGLLAFWLGAYAAAVDDSFEVLTEGSLQIIGNSPQPDIALHRRSNPTPLYNQSTPLLIIEGTYTSRSIDLGPKLDLYRRAKVPESICVLLAEERVEWRVLEGETYRLLPPTPNGILQSHTQSGLWLDTTAIFPPDRKRLLATIQQGVPSTNA